MMKVSDDQAKVTEYVCYLPHHAVLSKGGSKLLVVFDGSVSLNESLHVGLKLQTDITTVLSRWRSYRFALTADIVKMFRQILVNKKGWNWERILC